MYFFYFDESGNRDPSVGTPSAPKDHIYVLLAVGMYEGQWRRFETAISGLKLEPVRTLGRAGARALELADCEVKSRWARIPGERADKSPFLNGLSAEDLKRLTDEFYYQVRLRNIVVMASVMDKRYLHDHVTHEILHKKAYEFMLERIQHYIREYHPRHRALIVMDDTDKSLNRAVAMKHARFQRAGNRNMKFPAVVEYPFFTRSELSNGVELADLLPTTFTAPSRGRNSSIRSFGRCSPASIVGGRVGLLTDSRSGQTIRRSSSPPSAHGTTTYERPEPPSQSDVGLGEPYRAPKGHPTGTDSKSSVPSAASVTR